MDHLDGAKELLANYWERDGATDADLDTQLRQAELLSVIAYALIAIAENGRRSPE